MNGDKRKIYLKECKIYLTFEAQAYIMVMQGSRRGPAGKVCRESADTARGVCRLSQLQSMEELQ